MRAFLLGAVYCWCKNRKGQVKDIRRFVLVINEVTKFMPPSRRDYYRLRMFDIVVVIYSGSVPVISNL